MCLLPGSALAQPAMTQPVTLILGLGREIGEAIANHFLEHGHLVVAADPDTDRLATAEQILPDGVTLHHGELYSRKGLRNAMTAAIERHRRVDNLVILSPIEAADTLETLDGERLERAYAQTAIGAALALKVFAEHVDGQAAREDDGAERLRQRGTVTFVLSYSAFASMPGHFAESATQGAVLAVMRAGALELADKDIRVNAVVAIRPREERLQTWTARRTPLGRAASGAEIGEAVRYLASSGAAFVTGETLILDGGRRGLAGVLD